MESSAYERFDIPLTFAKCGLLERQSVSVASSCNGWPAASKVDVKRELKTCIKTKFEEMGIQLPKVEYKRPPTPQPRPPEKPEVVEQRRRQNKFAAMKSRKKRTERINRLRQKTRKYEESIRKHGMVVKKLREEAEQLKQYLISHNCCKNKKASMGKATTSTYNPCFNVSWLPQHQQQQKQMGETSFDRELNNIFSNLY
ncbi:predicted protein [Nematostella vectensis]|uniref:BZIP domain-containing protein n=1 Tax=Nematostella vectensis TaxID=45351 RepID=A7SNT7_NEMVE|nr:predicted protein [Nematostella vectensis]|eukprot:XP_001626705.1 predicted protein [Nematostella vectensis]